MGYTAAVRAMRKTRQQEFIQYDFLLAAWTEYGGKEPQAAYRQYVRAGLREISENPLKSALSD